MGPAGAVGTQDQDLPYSLIDITVNIRRTRGTPEIYREAKKQIYLQAEFDNNFSRIHENIGHIGIFGTSNIR